MTELNLVQRNEKGIAITNSLLVAKKFEKRHVEVLDAIRELMFKVENSTLTNNQAITEMFVLSEYDIPVNNGTGAIRKSPMYIMNRDGFTLLTMGFTGEKALKFKVEFIEAFNKMESLLNSDEFILMRGFQIMDSKIKQLEQANTLLEERNRLNEEQIQMAVPKVQYHDEVLNSPRTYTSTQIAKEIGFRSAEKLHLWLQENKIMFHQSGQWMLTAKYTDKGYTKPRTHTYLNHKTGLTETNTITVWTEKGRKLLHEVISESLSVGV